MSQPNFQFGPPAGIGAAMPAQSSQPAPQQSNMVDDPTRVVVGPVVISYPNLFIPRAKDNKDPNSARVFSAEFLVYQDNPKFQQIYQQLMAAAEVVCQDKFKRSINTMEKKPVRDLAVRNSEKPGFFFSANTVKKPAVLAGNPPMPVTDSDIIYPGAIVYVTVRAGFYENSGNRGIKFWLNSVLKVADGTPLVANRNAADDFSSVMAEAQQYMQSAVPAYSAPTFAPPQQPAAPVYANVPVAPGYPPAQMQMPPGYPPAAYGMPPMPGYPLQ